MINSKLLQVNALSGAHTLMPRMAIHLFFTLMLAFAATSLSSPSVFAQNMADAQMSSININSADAEDLASVLVGVGLTRAQEIVRYRETYGPFASVDELTSVKGIGPSTLDKNRSRITLE